MRGVLALSLVSLTACGRIGYDARRTADAAADSPEPPMIDAPPPPPVCPIDTLEIAPDSHVCIEIAQRGNQPWDVAKADCESIGRRLCADAEWYAGCINDPALMNMFGDGYEWVAEEAAGVAQKRGNTICDDTSSHQIIDPYDYRCCADKH